MKKDYIIVNSDNKWTDFLPNYTEKQALEILNEYKGEEDTYYLYEAKEIKSIN